MKTIALIALLSLVAGCAMTPTEKKWTTVAVGVVVVGAIAAHELDNGGRKNPCPTNDCGHLVQIPN